MAPPQAVWSAISTTTNDELAKKSAAEPRSKLGLPNLGG